MNDCGNKPNFDCLDFWIFYVECFGWIIYQVDLSFLFKLWKLKTQNSKLQTHKLTNS